MAGYEDRTLILFSKYRDFAAVLKSIARHVPEHPNCKRETRRVGETEFRYLFRQKNDETRDIHLAVLAFNIPSPNGT